MDIGSNSSYPASKLSNFTRFEFELDGVICASMEGFLQGLKFENINSQEITCSLTGLKAKRKGRKRNKIWQSSQTLWWRGKPFKRKSEEYQLLLNRAYNALYRNENFKKTLKDAGDAIFTHSIGNNKQSQTVLTTTEFCSRLQHLKDYGELREINKYYENA